MSQERPKIGVCCFVWRDGKFLMGRRKGSHGADKWSIPGGHMEFGESLEETAARETLEETGMKVKNVRFVAITNDISPEENKHYLTVWMEGDWESGEPTVTEPDKWVDHEWHTFKDMPEPLFAPFWDNLRKARPDLF